MNTKMVFTRYFAMSLIEMDIKMLQLAANAT